MARPYAERPEFVPRAMCYACFRPQRLCYCSRVSPIANKTRILIIQHPRERFHPFGTARIVHRCLSNSEIVVAHRRTLDAVNSTDQLPAGCALLYPAPDAGKLSDVPTAKIHTVVVLDGTWHHAKTLYRDLPRLHALPRFAFVPPRPTEYRVRREPKAEYVSTVEAVTHVLEQIEPETPGLEAMLDSFRKLIDEHLAENSRTDYSPRRKRQAV